MKNCNSCQCYGGETYCTKGTGFSAGVKRQEDSLEKYQFNGNWRKIRSEVCSWGWRWWVVGTWWVGVFCAEGTAVIKVLGRRKERKVCDTWQEARLVPWFAVSVQKGNVDSLLKITNNSKTGKTGPFSIRAWVLADIKCLLRKPACEGGAKFHLSVLFLEDQAACREEELWEGGEIELHGCPGPLRACSPSL